MKKQEDFYINEPARVRVPLKLYAFALAQAREISEETTFFARVRGSTVTNRFIVPDQVCTSSTVKVAMFSRFEFQVLRKWKKFIWIHTHPKFSAKPSSQDLAEFERMARDYPGSFAGIATPDELKVWQLFSLKGRLVAMPCEVELIGIGTHVARVRAKMCKPKTVKKTAMPKKVKTALERCDVCSRLTASELLEFDVKSHSWVCPGCQYKLSKIY